MKIIIAYLTFVVAAIPTIYWFYFWNKYEILRIKNYNQFKQLYYDEISKVFPLILKYPNILLFASTLLFLTSGILFLQQKTNLFKILAIMSFLFALLHLNGINLK